MFLVAILLYIGLWVAVIFITKYPQVALIGVISLVTIKLIHWVNAPKR